MWPSCPPTHRAPGWVRLVIVSDTHNVPIPVALFPPGDLLIHAAEVAGLKLFGSPYVNLTPRRRAMAPENPLRHEGFIRDDARLEVLCRDISVGLDVLITHMPPLGILDISVRHGGIPREPPISWGCSLLRKECSQGARPAVLLPDGERLTFTLADPPREPLAAWRAAIGHAP